MLGILKDDVRKQLLQERGLTLAKSISICRASEAAETQAAFNESGAPPDVNKVASRLKKSSGAKHKSKQKPKNRKPNTKPEVDCCYCGYKHIRDKQACPILREVCKKCGLKDHYA